MRRRPVFAIAISCALAAVATAHASGIAPFSSTTPVAETAKTPPPGQPIEFRDQTGKTITSNQFTEAVKKGHRYTAKKDMQKGRIVMVLLPQGVNTPGSKSWADMTGSSSGPNLALVPKPGVRLVDFDLPKVGGGRIDSAILSGKAYVVDFFFADCIGCIAELPVLNAYHKRYPGRQVFAVTFDDAKTAAGFVKQRHFDWPVAYNGKAFTDKLGIQVYPTMVVVGADGKVLATRVGEDTNATPESLQNWIAQSIHRSHESSDTR